MLKPHGEILLLFNMSESYFDKAEIIMLSYPDVFVNTSFKSCLF